MPTRHCKGKHVHLSQEIKEFIYANYHGNGPKQMAGMIRESFGYQVTPSVIKSFYANHHLRTGVTGCFQKGEKPWNKGMKGWSPAGCKKTWFKKGSLPVNTTKPVGTERISKDGYLEIKVAMPNKWKGKHRIIWEEHHGEIPKGHVVIFKDQNIRNFDPDNLMCISRRQLSILNHQLKLGPYPEINETKELISRMMVTRRKTG